MWLTGHYNPITTTTQRSSLGFACPFIVMALSLDYSADGSVAIDVVAFLLILMSTVGVGDLKLICFLCDGDADLIGKEKLCVVNNKLSCFCWTQIVLWGESGHLFCLVGLLHWSAHPSCLCGPHRLFVWCGHTQQRPDQVSVLEPVMICPPLGR